MNFMVTAIRADYCTNMTINNCSFSGFNNCIEMNFCNNFNILSSSFFNSNNAVFLSNCYGKGAISNNYTHNVNNLISIADSKLKYPLPSKNKDKHKIIKKEQKKNSSIRNIEFNKKIKELINLEANQKFIKRNYQLACKIKYIKANLGKLETENLLKNLTQEYLK